MKLTPITSNITEASVELFFETHSRERRQVVAGLVIGTLSTLATSAVESWIHKSRMVSFFFCFVLFCDKFKIMPISISFKDSLESNLQKTTVAMKSALEETGTRIHSNLELITHLSSDNCLRDKNQNFEHMKHKLALSASERARKYTQSISQCSNGNLQNPKSAKFQLIFRICTRSNNKRCF